MNKPNLYINMYVLNKITRRLYKLKNDIVKTEIIVKENKVGILRV